MVETSGRGLPIKQPADNYWKRMLEDLTENAFAAEASEDEAKGWPPIEVVKFKDLHLNTVLPHTQQLSIFLGSRISRRKPDRVVDRKAKWRNGPNVGMTNHGRSESGGAQHAAAKVVANETGMRCDRGDGSWVVNELPAVAG